MESSQGSNMNNLVVKSNRLNTAIQNLSLVEIRTYTKGFKGFKAYESYTKEQLQALKEYICFLHEKYNIKLDYHENMWEVSRDALVGTWGIWTHVSYREDKSDCHPDPELITMLKSLK